MAQPYNTVSSTPALSIQSLRSRGALDRSYGSRVYFRKLHHVLVDLDGHIDVVVVDAPSDKRTRLFGGLSGRLPLRWCFPPASPSCCNI